jgi:hypothetical protein
MAYTCPDISPSSDVGSGDSPAVGDMVAPGAFDAPSFEDPKNVVPFSNAWWNSQYQSNVAQGQKCADPAYNTAGQLVGTAFVARDIKAMAEALGQDGYIRYWGTCSHTAQFVPSCGLTRYSRLFVRHLTGSHCCRNVPRQS